MRILVLGGTAWLGGWVASLAAEHGHDVTALAELPLDPDDRHWLEQLVSPKLDSDQRLSAPHSSSATVTPRADSPV